MSIIFGKRNDICIAGFVINKSVLYLPQSIYSIDTLQYDFIDLLNPTFLLGFIYIFVHSITPLFYYNIHCVQ